MITWHLLSDPDARFYDLGPGYHATRADPERRKRTHIRELKALGYTVTLKPPPEHPAQRPAPPGAAANLVTHQFSD